MIKILNWIKCNLLKMHEFEEKKYITPQKYTCCDLQLVKCKHCNTKEFK